GSPPQISARSKRPSWHPTVASCTGKASLSLSRSSRGAEGPGELLGESAIDRITRLATPAQAGAYDDSMGSAEVGQGLEGYAARDKDAHGGVEGIHHCVEVGQGDAAAGAAPGDQHGVREAAVLEFIGLLRDRAGGERSGVLHVDIAEEEHVPGAE